MNYTIKYIVLCEKGKKRQTNQDNFWCNGYFLANDNNGLSTPLTDISCNTTTPIFAIFDGMGGAKCGEMAAYLAAKSFDSLYTAGDITDPLQFLISSCKNMNSEICSYATENQAMGMGTTAAILAFGKKKIHVCNIGDSKVFLRDAKTLTQISQDHIVLVPGARKPPLSQHLGIQPNEFVIEPYFATGIYGDGDRYLLCSDGLTDMVSLDEIDTALSAKNSVTDTANFLMETALYNGGSDNITIILCELQKSKFFRRKVSK